MRNILFAALVLGCLTEVIFAARRGVFEFEDDQGNCWSCAPGVPCERCRGRNQLNECLPPDCNNPATRGILYPSATLRFYFQCMPDGSGNWIAVKLECPCDLLFDSATQQCTYPFNFVPVCDFAISDPTVIDCAEGPPTGPTDPPPTGPTDPPPTGPTEPPPSNNTTTNVDATTTTTRAPCVCIIWWPCQCNPCWMSRHPSCMMMMG